MTLQNHFLRGCVKLHGTKNTMSTLTRTFGTRHLAEACPMTYFCASNVDPNPSCVNCAWQDKSQPDLAAQGQTISVQVPQ